MALSITESRWERIFLNGGVAQKGSRPESSVDVESNGKVSM